MPCIEISLPKVSQETKSALAHELTKAFCSSTGHPPDIFGLRFFEYEPGTAAVAGKVLDEQAPQEPPYLHMLVYCPRLRRSVKQKLGAELTRAFRSASG
ncbi:MAG: hypothetical protein HUU37_02765 [Bdellovibrionales bacterium]|nr:hypothetical protein [Bdellovibrionales bacterium]